MSLRAAPRIVLTYGIFDWLSPGDARFLREAARLGTGLVVGCATDAFCAARGVRPALPFARRRAMLERCRFVDRVIPEDTENQKRTDIVNCNVSTIVMSAEFAGLYDDLRDVAAVRYLQRPATTLLQPETQHLAVAV